MKRTPVTSSSIASVGYDDAEQVMEIEFRTGKVYQYPMIPREKYDALMAAPSVGKYYAANFKQGGH
jgi:hypothetical protein